MPVNRVFRSGRVYGFRWGTKGKVYTIGKYGAEGAQDKSLKQGKAILSSKYGWKRRYELPKQMTRHRRAKNELV
jgi:hypothetical protein